ncbi:MAG: efflux RND transporter periplasmic adaptor subunit [Vicinamibacteria bacterium]
MSFPGRGMFFFLAGSTGLLALALLWRWPSANTVEVTRGDLILTADIEGGLRAIDAYPLGPPGTSGMWTFQISFMAPEGHDVTAGTPVLAFDATELEQQLVDRRAERQTAEQEIEKRKLDMRVRQADDEVRVSEAKAKLEKANLKLTRPGDLVAARETRKLELDRALAEREVKYLEERRLSLDEADRTELENLVEQRDRAGSRVRELERTIARLTLEAPRDGTVVHIMSRNGEKKRVGDQAWRREKVLAVPDLRRMVADGHVDESEAGKLRVGQKTELRLDAYPEIAFTGRLAAMGKIVQPVSRNSPLRGLRAEVALDETDTTRMRPDMRFRGKIEVGRIEDALLVPLRAVDRVGGKWVVRRSGVTGASPAEVTLGRTSGELVEVLAGLSEGDRLVVPDGGGKDSRR